MIKKYRQAENIVMRKIAGETFLVPVISRMADLQTMFALNSIGSFLWENMAEEISGDELVALVTKKFAVGRDDAEKDVLEFLASLENEGLIR